MSTRRARIVFAAVALWLVAAVPTLAVQGPTKLERASVSAVKGTTSTVFTFEVTYRSVTGISPDYVRVSVAGSTHAMTGSGTHWRDGVRFRWRGTLPNGTHVVVFRARDAERFVDELKYRSRIVVGSGGPGPDASVDPSDGASADPSDEPDSGDGVAPPPIDGRDSPWNEPGGPGGEADASLGGGTTAGPPPAATDDGVDRSPAAFLGWLGDRLADAGTTILATIGGGSAANGAAALIGHGTGTMPAASVVVTTSGLTAGMAFSLFGKRRRDGEPPASDAELRAEAVQSAGIIATAALATAPAKLDDPEALMPRWRRPSLLEARKSDPVRGAVATRARLSFGASDLTPGPGAEVRLVRYAVVPLLDRPDELTGRPIGEIEAGDEVEVVAAHGAYRHVRLPDAREAWVHRTTLGDLVARAAMGPSSDEAADGGPAIDAAGAMSALLAARGIRG